MNKKGNLMLLPVLVLVGIMIVTLLALLTPTKNILLNVINNQLNCSVDDENTRVSCLMLKGSLIFIYFIIFYFIIKAVINISQE